MMRELLEKVLDWIDDRREDAFDRKIARDPEFIEAMRRIIEGVESGKIKLENLQEY